MGRSFLRCACLEGMEERAEIRARAKRLAKAGGQLQQTALVALGSGIQIDEPRLGGSPAAVDALLVVRESRAQLGELILEVLYGPFSVVGGLQARAFPCACVEPPNRRPPRRPDGPARAGDRAPFAQTVPPTSGARGGRRRTLVEHALIPRPVARHPFASSERRPSLATRPARAHRPRNRGAAGLRVPGRRSPRESAAHPRTRFWSRRLRRRGAAAPTASAPGRSGAGHRKLSQSFDRRRRPGAAIARGQSPDGSALARATSFGDRPPVRAVPARRGSVLSLPGRARCGGRRPVANEGPFRAAAG